MVLLWPSRLFVLSDVLIRFNEFPDSLKYFFLFLGLSVVVFCGRGGSLVDRKMSLKFQVFIYVLIVPTTLGNPLLATNKLSLATWGSYYQQDHKGPGTYAFGYDIEDPVTGNIQFKQEERHPNGTVTGNYGYVDADGKPHVVTYVSDENGYRAKLEVEGEPTKYFPDTSHFLHGEQTTKGQEDSENDLEAKYNPLVVPLQGEDIQPNIPITHRLDYPSYYNHVGVNAVSK